MPLRGTALIFGSASAHNRGVKVDQRARIDRPCAAWTVINPLRRLNPDARTKRCLLCALFDIKYTAVDSTHMAAPDPVKVDILQGTLDLMVLQTLDTLGPMHGCALARRLEQVSRGALHLNMGTLYPGLMRLEQRGFVRGKWGITETHRRARFYSITAGGRRQLVTEKAAWDRMAAIIHKLMADPA